MCVVISKFTAACIICESKLALWLPHFLPTTSICFPTVDLPSTPVLTCSPIVSTISCSWEQRGPNPVTSYLLMWRYVGPCAADSQSFLLDGGSMSSVLRDLEEGGNYSITLTPMNSVGAGAPGTFQALTGPAGMLI